MSETDMKLAMDKFFGEPLGYSVRVAWADYRDEQNNYFSCPFCATYPPGPYASEHYERIWIEAMINTLEAQGYAVYSIVEMLGGCTQEEFIALLNNDRDEALRRIKLLYFDPSKERSL